MTEAKSETTYKISVLTGIAIVVANMVGTGVFTSLGFQVLGIQSGFALLMLWVVGGVIALCGALSYGELAAAMPRSGGEYHYLSQIYHPALGFLSGWVSATVGFAAPTALAAMALGKYAQSVWPSIPPTALSVSVVVALTAVHALSRQAGSRLQVVITSVKVLVLVAFISAGWAAATPQPLAFLPHTSSDWKQLLSPAFAVSLVYVSYAYSGWNAAVYLTGEVREPQRNLPRILLIGTAIVLGLYVGLNFIFLYSTPISKLAGQVEVGFVAATELFGIGLGRLMGGIIAVLLVSTVSSMVFAGPRIVQVMGEDLPALRWLGHTSKNAIPVRAIIFQAALTLLFIVSATFEAVLLYAGFVLSLFTFLTVLGLFVLRWRQPDLPRPYRAWGYPITPLLFLGLNGWTLWFIAQDKPTETRYGLLTLTIGLLVYFVGQVLMQRVAVARKP
ncbi:amino acid/polyamine/organocation transporter, APC superfamily [Hymenobacter gelipurpurascens]|uniref:Amino acid/polyamine/organocation transporter, APC superfamily n=1 Tax=Hymenobacter gelipurpurascens TaxID=89968 RepID=A0A212UH84_9BACT|nr:amino acid permease [Hymenobacter gelipurpurascens]SNC77523.1 amino acid/polyamine/organocation transporter, APC superfamily [Hymenobacter gelipurpurascens]